MPSCCLLLQSLCRIKYSGTILDEKHHVIVTPKIQDERLIEYDPNFKKYVCTYVYA